MDLYIKLEEVVGKNNIKAAEPMKMHTTLKVGGPADIYVTPSSEDEIKKLISVCHEYKTPYRVIGHGSNLLVSDDGYRGVIIECGSKLSDISVDNTTHIIHAGSGAMLSNIAATALKSELTGMEFAAGIPGSLGGAVYMNAGAYGKEMKDVLVSVTVLTSDGQIRKLNPSELELGYRYSNIEEKGYTVCAADIKLEPGKADEISAYMSELAAKRRAKQPLEYPSAGSTFKRPEGHFAGQLIEEAGLKGLTIGGAQVSEKHCGFVINVGNASASDIYTLIQDVIAKVLNKSGIKLEPEVKMLGEF